MTDCQRFSPKLRMITLFYGCVEGVHVNVYDLSLNHFLRLAEQTYYKFLNNFCLAVQKIFKIAPNRLLIILYLHIIY